MHADAFLIHEGPAGIAAVVCATTIYLALVLLALYLLLYDNLLGKRNCMERMR